jgi:von Willebrand factor type A domain
MRARFWQATPLALALLLAACNFKPSTAGESGEGGTSGPTPTGMGGSSQPPSTGGVVGTGGSPGTGGGGVYIGSGGQGELTGAAGGCGQTNVSIKPTPPDILIVEDRSGSMAEDSNGNMNCRTANCSKWSQVATAIETVVQATDTNVNWGLIFFATDNMCAVNSMPIVPIGPMNGQKIQQAFTSNTPNGQTPTASAVDAAVTYMKTVNDNNKKFLLLATDGLPNCGTGSGTGGTTGAAGRGGTAGRGGGAAGTFGGGMIGGGSTADDSPAAETAVTNAKTAGFPTFVVGIATSGNQMASDTLNTLAKNGGYAQTGAATQYYSINDTASLEAALNKILGMTLSCTIPLGNAPPNVDNVAVSAMDASGKRIEIPKDDTNGWSFDANMANIVLNGSACQDLQSVTLTQYQFIFACANTKICIDDPCP